MLSSAIHAAALAHARQLTNDHTEAALLPLVDAYETGYHAAAATPALSLTHTIDPAAPYAVVAVVEPPTANWLHLPSLHAKLLPLAQAAGHEKLTLSVQIDGSLPVYEADASGGPSRFRRYISFFDYGSTPAQFEQVLTALLQQQATYLATSKQAA